MISNLPTFYKSPHTLACRLPSEAVLVGLSGGADSSCLIHLLALQREKLDFPLYAAHVNHGIRTEEYGNEADRDEEFCRRLCDRLGVELFVLHVDVPLLAQTSGDSLETAARDARYSFFAQIMQEKQIPILATAHNADDNLETQIFNLCRGCGLTGICGIPESRAFSEADGTVVRPILSASKIEILEFCHGNDIGYVTDSTTAENDCTRNRIRNIVIPELNSLFSTPQRAAARLSASAREDLDFIFTEAKDFLKENEEISVDPLLSLHKAVAKRAISIAFEDKSGATLEETHIKAILELAATKKNGSISLPCGFSAIFCDGMLKFDKIDTVFEKKDYNIKLASGENAIPDTDFTVTVTNGDPCGEDEEKYGVLFDRTRLCGISEERLFARNRREGDVILSRGMHKKLKKLLCDNKIPTSLRDSLPIVCVDGTVVYAPKCATADGYFSKDAKACTVISVYLKR